MHRASDRRQEQEALAELEDGLASLDLGEDVRSIATDLYLSALPLPDRSKPATLAASCYTATLIAGEERSQAAIADTFDVSRLAVQQRWKALLEESGFTAPDW